MSDSDIEQLTSFMGRTVGVRRGSYRLPDDIYQTAKMSKFLLLMENGESSQFKGKQLDEIHIDLEENILNNENDTESDVDGQEGCQGSIEYDKSGENNTVEKN